MKKKIIFFTLLGIAIVFLSVYEFSICHTYKWCQEYYGSEPITNVNGTYIESPGIEIKFICSDHPTNFPERNEACNLKCVKHGEPILRSEIDNDKVNDYLDKNYPQDPFCVLK